MDTALNSDTPLAELLDHVLKDVYSSERKIYRSLPDIIKACSDQQLADALAKHREETSEQIDILERIVELRGITPKSLKCQPIDAILAETDELLEDFGGTSGLDAGIIFACQNVEHYEISRYRSMHLWALKLGSTEIASLLATILKQERAADEKLASLAESIISSSDIPGISAYLSSTQAIG